LSLRILQYLGIRIEHVDRDAGGDALTKLDELIDAMYDVYDFDPIMIINLFHLQSSETLKNLSPQLMAEINALSKKSIASIARIFKEGIEQGVIVDQHPVALADIFWSLFSGVILWESSKKIIDGSKDYLKQTLGFAFKIFRNGIIVKDGSRYSTII